MTAWSRDLTLAFALADAADFVSLSHFADEQLRTTHKSDGTPVSQVDFDTERAMLDLVRRVRPDDAVVGEEIGPQPGSATRRWIFDGIDGTHNFALGRPGWATAIALEADGEIVVGLVSAPALGRRWWATRGGGAWSAPYRDDGTCDAGDAERLQRRWRPSLDTATVIVIPWEGVLLGWRNEVPRRFPLPSSPRSQCFALDAVMVADGRARCVDPHVRSLWDFAGHEPDRPRGRRRLPRRVGWRAIRHALRGVHERCA